MKLLIDRLLFWFYDESQICSLVERFSPWAALLTRLMLEKYTGRRMEYINIYFKTSETFQLYQIENNDFHYYGGHLQYSGLWDIEHFLQLSPLDQVRYVWNKGCEFLISASEKACNQSLADACRYAHQKGLELNLNPDFRRLSVPVELYGKSLLACVWIRYDQPTVLTLRELSWRFGWPPPIGMEVLYMTAYLTLEDGDQVLLEQRICSVELGYSFFPSWIKKIEVKNGNTLIVKGHYELDCLPLKIPISKEVVWGNE